MDNHVIINVVDVINIISQYMCSLNIYFCNKTLYSHLKKMDHKQKINILGYIMIIENSVVIWKKYRPDIDIYIPCSPSKNIPTVSGYIEHLPLEYKFFLKTYIPNRKYNLWFDRHKFLSYEICDAKG